MTLVVPQITCTAPVNIAVIKYWGKRNVELNLPTNSSLSVTLHQDDLHTKTSVAALLGEKGSDRLWLNNKEVVIQENKRVLNLLSTMRELCALHYDEIAPEKHDFFKYPLHICSQNSFPTAAGLASSASGYACLVGAISALYGLDTVLSLTELSGLARIGSGSACRSLFGGFVEWDMGSRPDGKDSVAIQIQPETFWPEMSALICVVGDTKKEVSSTLGMQTTVKTSSLLHRRISVDVPERMDKIKAAISQKDFDTFAKLTIQDSNSFHACCLDTFPPIFYMNDTSRFLVRLVNMYNEFKTDGGALTAAYTFDAGPNAVVYTMEHNIGELLAIAQMYFPGTPCQGSIPVRSNAEQQQFTTDFIKWASLKGYVLPEGCKYELVKVITTRVGPGVLQNSTSLLDSRGFPLE